MTLPYRAGRYPKVGGADVVAKRLWTGFAAGLLCLALGACTPETGAAGAGSAATVDEPAPAAVAAPAAPSAPVAPAGTAVAVLRVVDGDTFRTADGLDVRVLGIDSCEAATPGGKRATAAARALLVGSSVTLTPEPGVDRDRYGRALRYVAVDGRDLAEAMVTSDHTAVYTGRNDASPARQATLRRLDRDGRTCGVAAPASRPSTQARPAPARPAADVDRPRTRTPAAAAAPAKPRKATAPKPSAPRAASYANCSAAKAAGVAPLHRGQAGYSSKLDRDGDGVACER